MNRIKHIGLLLCAGLGLGAQGTPVENEQPAVSQVGPAERIQKLGTQVRAAQWDLAIQGGEELLRGAAAMGERQLSEVHFATALARAMLAGEEGSVAPSATTAPAPVAGQPPLPAPVLGAGYLAASIDFESSRALAGGGELRLSAAYDLGTASLLRAELWRQSIPEVAQAMGQQAPPQATTAADGEEAPDPLEQARAAYLLSKEHLLVRLRLDWNDADNRANLELIQRRLRELQEIEEERKKQEEEQDSEDKSEDSEDQEEGDEGEPGEDQDKDQEQQDDEEQDKQDQDQKDDEGESEEQQDEEQEGEQEGEQEQPEEQEGDDSEAQGQEAESEQREPVERVLTREEVIRLLDKLSELEAEAEELKAARAKRNTVRVDRDW